MILPDRFLENGKPDADLFPGQYDLHPVANIVDLNASAIVSGLCVFLAIYRPVDMPGTNTEKIRVSKPLTPYCFIQQRKMIVVFHDNYLSKYV